MREFEYLVCPTCKNALILLSHSLFCDKCKLSFELKENIPILIDPNQINEFKKVESDFHSSIAEKTDDAHSLHSLRVKILHESYLEKIKILPPNQRILDIACGSGIDTIELCKYGHFVEAVDISYGMCKITERKIKNHNFSTRARVIQADADNLPFSDNYFDAVIMSGSLHHFPEINVALKELKRVVKNQGLIIIGSEPNQWPYLLRFLKYSRKGKKFLSKIRNDYTIEGGSIADYTTKGFSKNNFIAFAATQGFKIKSLDRQWYISGFISLLGLKPKEKIERGIIRFDKVIKKIPILKKFSWKWNCIYENFKDY